MLKHQPKTLAKTLDFIATRAPGEYGLFWDTDGTMPWKEFYWALQEDAKLRFVRESNIRELMLLGMDLSFRLDGNRIHLTGEAQVSAYSKAVEVPARLYCGVKPNNLVVVQKYGLRPAGRTFIPLFADREFASRFARRRESAPILLEVFAHQAIERGIVFLVGGPQLYLVDHLAAEFILFPQLRQDFTEKLAEKAQKVREKPPASAAPGSFLLQPHHLEGAGSSGKQAGKAGRCEKAGWKKESRKERRKREV